LLIDPLSDHRHAFTDLIGLRGGGWNH
jgi:hypothetical protein